MNRSKTTVVGFFVAISGLFCSHFAYAQISVGIKGGLLFTSFDKSPLAQDEPVPEFIPGLQFGIPVEFEMGKVLAFQPELMFGSHGGLQQSNSDVTNLGIRSVSSLKVRYQVNTLEIPLLLKLRFGPDNFKFHVLAGPSIGFGLSGTSRAQLSNLTTLSNGFVLIDQKSDQRYKAKFVNEGYPATALTADQFGVAKADINAHFGAGISINLGGPELFLDGRFILGLSDLRPESATETQNIVFKSKRIGLSLGVMFPL